MDLAEGHKAALGFLAQETGWHAINLGTGTGYSVLEMVKAFEAASKQAVPFRVTARRAGDIASCYAKADKAKQTLGWQAKRTLEDMCASTWQFQSNQ
jgi:UDP-glucose 4-epimerase